MTSEGIAKVQHYVPQFLLKNLGAGKKKHIWVLDKNTDKVFLTNTKNVASESRFYDFKAGERDLSLEPILGLFESGARPILQRILDEDSLAGISEAERRLLSEFFAVQFVRTKAFRERMTSLPRLLREHLKDDVISDDPNAPIHEYLKIPNENDLKVEAARWIVTAPREFGFHFLTKRWVLLRTSKKRPYMCGDNPLALQNMVDMAPYGNLGLAVRGIEIYFPLSDVRALAMWCPTFAEQVLDGAVTLRRLRQVAHSSLDLLNDPAGVERLARCIETGHPLPATQENVMNFNSLQIRHAERYVFSSTDDFSLAHMMIQNNESVRGGMSFTL